jgi:hypothetical protein
MKKLLAVALFAVLSLPLAASAQNSTSDDCAAQRKKTGVCKLDFMGDRLTGEIARPDGEGGTGRPDVKHPSLIRLRKEFVLRIVASAENR